MEIKRPVKFRMFRSTYSTWNTLLTEVAEFASRIGADDVISISQSEDKGEGVLVVWYRG